MRYLVQSQCTGRQPGGEAIARSAVTRSRRTRRRSRSRRPATAPTGRRSTAPPPAPAATRRSTSRAPAGTYVSTAPSGRPRTATRSTSSRCSAADRPRVTAPTDGGRAGLHVRPAPVARRAARAQAVRTIFPVRCPAALSSCARAASAGGWARWIGSSGLPRGEEAERFDEGDPAQAAGTGPRPARGPGSSPNRPTHTRPPLRHRAAAPAHRAGPAPGRPVRAVGAQAQQSTRLTRPPSPRP